MMHDAWCTMYHALPMTFIVEVNQANLAWSFRQQLKWHDTHSDTYTDRDLEIMTTMARRAAAVISNKFLWLFSLLVTFNGMKTKFRNREYPPRLFGECFWDKKYIAFFLPRVAPFGFVTCFELLLHRNIHCSSCPPPSPTDP